MPTLLSVRSSTRPSVHLYIHMSVLLPIVWEGLEGYSEGFEECWEGLEDMAISLYNLHSYSYSLIFTPSSFKAYLIWYILSQYGERRVELRPSIPQVIVSFRATVLLLSVIIRPRSCWEVNVGMVIPFSSRTFTCTSLCFYHQARGHWPSSPKVLRAVIDP